MRRLALSAALVAAMATMAPAQDLENGRAVWNFSLEDAAMATVTIKDSKGNVVYTEKGSLQAGQGQFTWNGKTSTGGKAPDGTYSISMTGINAEGKTVPISTQFTGVVTGVDFTGSEPVLLIGQTRVNLSTVKAITITPPADQTPDTETPDDETPETEGA